MIALTFNEVKECMSKLLLSEMFDPFYFIEGEITTFSTFKIDGYLKKEFLNHLIPSLLQGLVHCEKLHGSAGRALQSLSIKFYVQVEACHITWLKV